MRMAFRARAAAARLPRRKAPVSRWTPALLRWARRRGRARIGVPSHSTTQLHSHSFRGSWVTQLNLHFHLGALFRDSRPSTVTLRRGSRAAGSPSTPRSSSIARGSPVPRQYANARAPHPKALATAGFPRVALRRASLVSGSPVISQTAVTAVTVRESELEFVPAACTARRSVRVPRLQPPAGAFARRPVHRSPRLPAPPLGCAPERLFADGLHEFARPARRAVRAPAARTGTSAAAAQYPAFAMRSWMTQSPVDLVWRAPPDRSAGTLQSTGARPAHGSAAAPPPQTPSTVSRTTEQTIVRAAALEPGLADRLTDDVIRRIDRRARIERERKGM